ncbi:MAG TPA: enoyl-CoA hydratase/isomerase family protein [Halococcus sp.]|nr:enoyl-CoA hydratase/isomerase family protein [Halococcus sp.]
MIETTVTERVAYVTIDRPRKRNALTSEGLDDLKTAIERLDTPVLCLRGAGAAFCAGADLATVAGLDSEDAEEFARRGQQVATAIENSKAVVVAAIDGAARGGGVELTLACDVRIASPDATFAETGVQLGLFGAWGGTHRLPEIVGLGNALDIALSGQVIDVEAARRIGLVSRIVENPEKVAASIAENDPAVLRVVKERVRDDATPERQDQREAEAFAGLIACADLSAYRE